ncbi:PEP-CTERM sorting domain-containing protein [Coraliomargarita algicola]|uniref:PEP-CTERM sorting domain-containing protein n=1 Tax=Coraliomargarita algicola TaxID=3092156 RepID=A0ABZ0RHB8_9BACT|nr:PEP-CTERM sorting domain-containing protein [Coraliomargarita sp. J2-16]WPJ95579.1 PEP-CTERM sorting domain-containing protein [Coraliomargarita sp. J2-16]
MNNIPQNTVNVVNSLPSTVKDSMSAKGSLRHYALPAFIMAVTSTLAHAETEIVSYDFDALSNGALTGSTTPGDVSNQDGWYTDANNGGSPIIWDVVTTSGGIYDGDKAIQSSGRAIKAYDNSFFESTTGSVAFDFTFSLKGEWQSLKMGLAGDGTVSSLASYQINTDRYSPIIGVGSQSPSNGIYFSLAGIPTYNSPWATSTVQVTGLDITDYYTVRLVVDPDANAGSGSGTVYYRNETDAGEWTIVGGTLEDFDLNLENSASGNTISDWNQVYFNGGDGNKPTKSEVIGYSISSIPEPSAMSLLLGCAVGFLAFVRRKRS